jgi:membrane protein DedA with SNARE-associated domain
MFEMNAITRAVPEVPGQHDEATTAAPTGPSRSRRPFSWLAVGAAGAVAARYAIGGAGVLHVLPGSAGSLFLGQHAYALVFLAALAESTAVLGLLLPGAGLVALSGAGAREVGLSASMLPVLVLLSAAGLLGGAVANYHLGRLGLGRLLRQPWTGAWGPRLEAQLTASAPLLERHGWWVALVASAFGAARSSLAVAAGAGGFPLRRLLAIQLPAALLWSGLYAGGGYLLADQWARVEQAVRQGGAAGVGAAVLGSGAWWGARRWLPAMPVSLSGSDRARASGSHPTATPTQTGGPARPGANHSPGWGARGRAGACCGCARDGRHQNARGTTP